MEKILHPSHPVRCSITESSDCGKPVFLTTLVLNIFNENSKMYIYSPSVHQDSYQKLIERFSNYILIYIIPNILNDEDIDKKINEICTAEDFEKSDTEIQAWKATEEWKFFSRIIWWG